MTGLVFNGRVVREDLGVAVKSRIVLSLLSLRVVWFDS